MTQFAADLFFLVAAVWGILAMLPLVRASWRAFIRDLKGKVKVDR